MKKLRNNLFKLMFISVLLCELGCGTATNLGRGDIHKTLGVKKRVPMGGVAIDIAAVNYSWPFIFIAVPDLPLSFAADIVTLPYTVPYTLLKDPKKNEGQNIKQKIQRLKQNISQDKWNRVYKINSGDLPEWLLTDKINSVTTRVAKQYDLQLMENNEERITMRKGNEIAVYVISGFDKNPSYLILTNYHSGGFRKKYAKLMDRVEKEFWIEFGDRFHKVEENELPSNWSNGDDTQSK